MEAADIEANSWVDPSPPLPVDDAPASGVDDSHAIRCLEGLIARIGGVGRRHGNLGVLDLIGMVPDPEQPSEPVNSV